MDKHLVILVLSVALFQLSASARLFEINPFIVGGEPADIADFPHQLALFDTARGSICGASIVSRLWSLSAAHCLQHNTPPELVRIKEFLVFRKLIEFINRSTCGEDRAAVCQAVISSLSRDIFFIQTTTEPILILISQSLKLMYEFYLISECRKFILFYQQSGTPFEGWPNVTPVPLSPSCATACCGVCPAGNNILVTGWGRIDDGEFDWNFCNSKTWSKYFFSRLASWVPSTSFETNHRQRSLLSILGHNHFKNVLYSCWTWTWQLQW